MSTPIISVEELSHRYTGAWAIRDINFQIDKTGILGLLGSNGAGKSTIMNIICGVLNQTAGRVVINGIDLRKAPEQAKKQIGFLPQQAPLYMDMTGDEYLTHCAHLRQMKSDGIAKAVDEAKDRCGLTHIGHRLIKNLSGGYRQRVGIAQAIIHRPKLVVLDEPTNGLDPNQIIEVRSLIREIAADRAVIFSTHILSEVQVLCKEIRMIEQGQLVFADTLDAFNNYVSPHSIRATMQNPPADAELQQLGGITRIERDTPRTLRIHYDGGADITDRIIAASVEKGWELKEIYLEKGSLDDVFASLSKRAQATQLL